MKATAVRVVFQAPSLLRLSHLVGRRTGNTRMDMMSDLPSLE